MNTFYRILIRHDLVFLMVGLVALTLLAACEMTAPSHINASPIRVTAQTYSETMPATAFTPETAKLIGKDFRMQGQGPVDVTVVYGLNGTDKKAMSDARRIGALLEQQGVGPVTLSTLPVNEKGRGYDLMLTFKRVKAHPPADCGGHPADDRAQISGNDNGRFESYRYGCGIDSYVAQQVARPRDLLGSDQMDSPDGSHYGNILKDYRDGKPAKDLKGQTASETKL